MYCRKYIPKYAIMCSEGAGRSKMFLIGGFLTRDAIVVYPMAFPKLLLTNTTSTAAYLEQKLREQNSFVERMC